LLPTGTTDPFALRRQTLGIIRIVLETPLRISLGELIDRALVLLSDKLTQPAQNVKADILAFFEARLHNYLASRRGFSPDVIGAALSVGIDDLLDAVARTEALARFTARPDFGAVAAAFKRVANIIKAPEAAPVEESLFKSPAEKLLWDGLIKSESVVSGCLVQSDFAGALESMAQLKPMIDAFFDSVLVMDKEDSVRRNRLALLTRTRGLFSRVADFGKIP
jgi:glycyl-tRNA synthetase beta chain